MPAPVYRLVQRFVRIEAVGMRGARHGDAEDPLSIQVAVTPSDNINVVVETVSTAPTTRDRLWRVATGIWAFQLNPALYESGKSYTVHYRYMPTPNNTQVTRRSFVWDPVPEQAHGDTQAILHGTLLDFGGLPAVDGHVIVETYQDYVSLNQRTGARDITSDAFGHWWVEVPQNTFLRLVGGSAARLVRIGSVTRADAAELKDYQPQALLRLDRFGYPIPGQSPRMHAAGSVPPASGTLVGEGGAAIPDDDRPLSLVVSFPTPLAIWSVVHNGNCYPLVDVVDSTGHVMDGDVFYASENEVQVFFNSPRTGKLILFGGTPA